MKTDNRITKLEILSIKNDFINSKIKDIKKEIYEQLKSAIDKQKDRVDVGIVEYSKKHMDAIAYWLYQYQLLINFQKHQRDMKITSIAIENELIDMNEKNLDDLLKSFDITLPT